VLNSTAPPAWRARELHAAGTRIAAFEAGSTAPEAPVVMLLHGLGHWSDAAWGRLLPEFDPSRRYFAFDLPGFGESERPEVTYDLAYFRRVVDELAAAAGIARFALVGHSLGGLIAAEYAGAAPARVTRLALIAPAGFAKTSRVLVYALASGLARWLFTRKPSRGFVVRTLQRSVVDPAVLDPATIDRAVALSQDLALRKAFAGVYAGAIQAFAHSRRLHAGFARYTGPVFCAWGRQDRYIPVAALREVERVYPRVESLVLEHSGHLPMIEEPAMLGAALRRFLAGTGG
jgi:pimeloyl-ACP methyl ester carboxylesterase